MQWVMFLFESGPLSLSHPSFWQRVRVHFICFLYWCVNSLYVLAEKCYSSTQRVYRRNNQLGIEKKNKKVMETKHLGNFKRSCPSPFNKCVVLKKNKKQNTLVKKLSIYIFRNWVLIFSGVKANLLLKKNREMAAQTPQRRRGRPLLSPLSLSLSIYLSFII